MRIAFLGLGQMGSAVARHLIKAGHELTVWNRTAAHAEPFTKEGAKVAHSPSEAVMGCEVIFTMVTDDTALEEVLFRGGVIKAIPEGSTHVSLSTISVALSQRLAEEHAKSGQRYVAAPVFGRPDVAAAGQLVVVAAGESTAVAAAGPLLQAIARKVFEVGEVPQAANLVKLSGNFLNAAIIESLGEAFALITKGGIDRQRYLEILATLFNVPAYNVYGGLIASGRFEPPGFAAPLGQKDIRLLLASADTLGVPMPLAGLLRDRFLRLMAHGGDRLDWSAIGGLPAQDAGLAAA